MIGRFLLSQWFLLALAVALALGFFAPAGATAAADSVYLRNTIVAAVLFLMALPLPIDAIWRIIRRPAAAGLSSFLNMFLMPVIAWALSKLLTGDLSVGLVLAGVVPTTLASAAVWTRRAGGNDAVALMVTVVTNGICFVVTPYWLLLMTSQTVSMDVSQMITTLGILVVLPMFLAQLLRLIRPLAQLADLRKTELGIAAQLGMLSMVTIGAVHAKRSLMSVSLDGNWPWTEFLLMALLVILLHGLGLIAGLTIGRVAAINPADRIAIAIAGSQKTLMIGLYVAINYFGGLVLIPLVLYHIVQLLMDTVVAELWRRRHPIS